MKKHSLEFKLEVINYYKEHNYGAITCGRHFNIHHSLVWEWTKKFELWGESGLTTNKLEYDGNFKVNVIEYMHKYGVSLTKTMILFNLGSTSIIKRWERIYNEKGRQALLESSCGKSSNMVTYKKKKDVDKDIFLEVGNKKDITKDLSNEVDENKDKEYKKLIKELSKNVGTEDKELLKALIKDFEYMRMENDYLKKFNALVQKMSKR